MVATLLKLRLLVLRNSLRRSTWQLVAMIIGALYGLAVLALVVAGLIALSFAPIEVTTTVLVLAGSGLILGWIVVPILTTGIEQTLDPARLAQYPLPMSKLLAGLTLAGVLGIPGIITTIAVLGTVVSWMRYPLAAVAAFVCAVIAVLTCVVGSRMVAALSVSLQSQRRFREISSILIFIPLILLGPIIIGVSRSVRTSADALPGVAAGLGWTPLGAVWSVPADLAAGDPGAAGLKFLIALATLALLVVIWRRSLASALVSPHAAASKRVARGKIGLFGLFPATPAGAVAARCLTYWRKDPRYARQLIMVPLLAVLAYFYYVQNFGLAGLITFVGPIIAFLLGLTLAADISYDGTAFATHVADGVRGRDDRLGRVAALAVIAVPVVLLMTIGSVALTNGWADLPALLGLSAGLLLTGFGLTSVSSARIVIPVPAAGDNPFKSAPGAGFTTALSTFATWGVLFLLALPEIVLTIIAFVTGSLLLGYLTLVVGVALGAVLMVVGIRMGGRELDRSGPRLLSRLKALRGA